MTAQIFRHILKALGTAAVSVVLAVPAAAGSVSYTVNVTSDLADMVEHCMCGGYALDFQFDPGTSDAVAAYATVSGFSLGVGGSMIVDSGVPSPDPVGDVTGTLPTGLVFENDTPFNDYWQEFLPGTSLSFVVTLSGPAIDNPDPDSMSGSTFGFIVLDWSGDPVIAGWQGLAAATVDLNPDGTTTPTWLADPSEGGITGGAPTPEPVTSSLAGLALIGLALVRKVRR